METEKQPFASKEEIEKAVGELKETEPLDISSLEEQKKEGSAIDNMIKKAWEKMFGKKEVEEAVGQIKEGEPKKPTLRELSEEASRREEEEIDAMLEEIKSKGKSAKN